MPKVITSPVKRWPGTVRLSDPLSFPQYQAWKAAVVSVKDRIAEGIDQSDADALLLPGVFACVETWHLDGLPQSLTVDTFPATPRVASARLIAWLVGAISALITEADETDPNS